MNINLFRYIYFFEYLNSKAFLIIYTTKENTGAYFKGILGDKATNNGSPKTAIFLIALPAPIKKL